jgi:hypothetical protein
LADRAVERKAFGKTAVRRGQAASFAVLSGQFAGKSDQGSGGLLLIAPIACDLGLAGNR